MTLPERPLGDVLRVAIDEELVCLNHEYSIAGVFGFGRGLFRRGVIRGEETSYRKLNRLSAGRIVMSRLKAFEGALAMIPPEFEGWYLSPEFPTFEIDRSAANDRYLANLCSWPELWSRLNAASKGVGARKVRVSTERLLAVPVPLPSLDEQHRIASRVDAILSMNARINGLAAHRLRLKAALGESLVSDAVKSAPGSVTIKEIMTLKRRQAFLEPGKVYHEIGVRSFGRGIFHKEPVPAEEIGEKRVFYIQAGDLIFSNVFAWEGAVALAGDAESGMIGSHRFMTYMVDDTIADATYLKHFFTTSRGLGVIRSSSPGSAGRNKTLGIKSFEAQHIPLPALRTQKRVAQVLGRINTELITHSSSLSCALQASTLNAAFSDRL